MKNSDLRKYLLKFLKTKKIKNIEDVRFVGAFLHSSRIEDSILAQTVTIQSINELISQSNFDVRKDDIIAIYSFIFSDRKYYAFINEPYEFMRGNYLINIIKVE